MQESAQRLIQTFPGQIQLMAFAGRLLEWLNHDLNQGSEPFTDSRARALLLAGDVLDEPTRHSFSQLVESEAATRIALHDLLGETGLAENEDVAVLAAASAGASASDKASAPAWLALAVAGHAFRSGFQLDRLDPAFPPDPYSPAGQVLKRAAFFIRQQVQRSATERDKLSRKLTHNPAAAGTPTLDSMSTGDTIAPLPPYFRPPVPVRYPEYTSEIAVNPNEVDRPAGPARGEPLSISDADLNQPAAAPSQPVIRIDPQQIEPPARPVSPAPRPSSPPANVVMPSATSSVNTGSAGTSGRRGLGSRRAPMKATKLRVVVQEYPDGPGLYGLQVRVSSRGIRRYVAGTTNKDGEFMCELPVEVNAGLTYDVDVTWPRDFGGEVERKSITLNADRTHFLLPFYRTLKA
jgi:hypothetical protein